MACKRFNRFYWFLWEGLSWDLQSKFDWSYSWMLWAILNIWRQHSTKSYLYEPNPDISTILREVGHCWWVQVGPGMIYNSGHLAPMLTTYVMAQNVSLMIFRPWCTAMVVGVIDQWMSELTRPIDRLFNLNVTVRKTQLNFVKICDEEYMLVFINNQ